MYSTNTAEQSFQEKNSALIIAVQHLRPWATVPPPPPPWDFRRHIPSESLLSEEYFFGCLSKYNLNDDLSAMFEHREVKILKKRPQKMRLQLFKPIGASK